MTIIRMIYASFPPDQAEKARQPRSSSNRRWVERRSRLGRLPSFSQDLRQNLDPIAELRRGLNTALVLELGPVAADDFAHRRTRHR